MEILGKNLTFGSNFGILQPSMDFFSGHDNRLTFCKIFKIPLLNCSCSSTPFLCEINSFEEMVIKNDTSADIFHRSNRITVIYAVIALLSSAFGAFLLLFYTYICVDDSLTHKPRFKTDTRYQ